MFLIQSLCILLFLLHFFAFAHNAVNLIFFFQSFCFIPNHYILFLNFPTFFSSINYIKFYLLCYFCLFQIKPHENWFTTQSKEKTIFLKQIIFKESLFFSKWRVETGGWWGGSIEHRPQNKYKKNELYIT